MTEEQSNAANAATAGTMLSPGIVIADRYRIESLLGEGGMGVVYRAEHVHMRKPYALKVLNADVSKSAEIVARFEREAIAAGNIAHPNVAAATDFGKLADGSFFLVLEYVAGRSLRVELDSGGAIEPQRAIRILRGMVAGVAAAHAKGIVHRDLKPENVMLSPRDGDPDFVKVLDFGIAKVTTGLEDAAAGAQPLTRLGTIFGTPDYMSPEQALGQAADHRADLYSLGIIFHEMLAGERPFRGGAGDLLRQHVLEPPPPLPASLAPHMSPRVGEIVQRLLEKTPDRRYENASALLAALDECAPPVSAPAPSSASNPSIRAVTTPVARPSLEARIGDIAKRSERSVSDAIVWIRASVAPKWIAAALAAPFVIVILVAVVVMRSSSSQHASASGAAAVTSANGASGEPSTDSPEDPTPPNPSASAVVLPPPPNGSSNGSSSRSSGSSSAPPTAADRPATAAPKRKTGPGGIYIPPPKTWFR